MYSICNAACVGEQGMAQQLQGAPPCVPAVGARCVRFSHTDTQLRTCETRLEKPAHAAKTVISLALFLACKVLMILHTTAQHA